MNNGSPETKLRQIFRYSVSISYFMFSDIKCCRIFDADNNGFISVDEMKKIVEHLFHLVPKDQKDILQTPENVSLV